MDQVNIFETAKPQGGEFFKFDKIGASVQGTYVDVRDGVDSFGNEQTIYVLIDGNGKVWNCGFRKAMTIIHERMKQIRFGQIVGFKFDEERPSKKPGVTNMAKIIRIYADPKLVDHAWLQQQAAIEKQYSGIAGGGYTPATQPTAPVTAAAPAYQPKRTFNPNDYDDGQGGTPNAFNNQVAMSSPTPLKHSMPTMQSAPTTVTTPSAPVSAEEGAIRAIHSLAITKGLASPEMKPEEINGIIEQLTGMKMAQENFSPIIMEITKIKR